MYRSREAGEARLRRLRYDEPMAPWGKRMCRFLKKTANAIELDTLLPTMKPSSSGALRAIGWTSVAVGVTALGLYIGRELRVRYKFKRRTPSDIFSHAGEEQLGAEYGVGV
jgi:hypothetical protein